MSITITDETMASDCVPVSARYSPDAAADGGGGWIVSCFPGRLYSRSQATTAMILAEYVAERTGDSFLVWDVRVRTWAGELWMSADEALARVMLAISEEVASSG